MECFMETSAKTGFNTRELFVNGAIALYLDHIKYMNEELKPLLPIFHHGYNFKVEQSRCGIFFNYIPQSALPGGIYSILSVFVQRLNLKGHLETFQKST